MPGHFSLIRERWLPVIRAGVLPDTVSLLDLFTQSGDLRSIMHPSPLATVALYRLVLAILYRTHSVRTIRAWDELRTGGWDNAKIGDYLLKHESRFDLFSTETPFFQRPDLDADELAPTPLSKLTHELVSKNNKQMFDHSRDDAPATFPPAEAACILLAAQCWSLGGGISGGKRPNFTNGPLVGGVATIVEGASLRETLVLNLVRLPLLKNGPHALSNIQDAGTPVWERDPDQRHDKRFPTGIADTLTWESRYIRLIPSEDGSVSSAINIQGEQINRGTTSSLDPMHSWRKSKKGQFLPIPFRLDRAAWRDATALLNAVGIPDEEGPAVALAALGDAGLGAGDSRFSVCIAGLANKKADPQHWTWQRFRIPGAFLESTSASGAVRLLRDAVLLCERVESVVRGSLAELGRSIYFERFENAGVQGAPDREQRERAERFVEALCRTDHYWSRMERAFHDFLADFGNQDRWRQEVRSAALDSFTASTVSFELTPRHARGLARARSRFYRSLSHHIPKEEKNEAA